MASIRERTSKTGERTWQVLYRHGTKQPAKTFDSAAAAEDFKTLVNVLGPDRALKAIAEDEQQQGLTVDQLFEMWLAWKGETKGGEPIRVRTLRTIEDYRRDYKNWVQPRFGHRAAEYVDETDVQEWVDHMVTKLARSSSLDRHLILHSMYDWGKARSRRHVSHNPCLETEWPKEQKAMPKGTTVPEFATILTAARAPLSEGGKANQDAADLILFLGETGWRWSEAAALPAHAVEDDGVDIWVTVTQVFRMIDNKQTLVPNAAKSYAGFRRIRMFPASAVMIRRRMVGLGPGDLVFTNSRGNKWNQNTWLRVTWPGILTAAGMWKGARKSPTPHWLRHMHVAVLAAAKVPIQEIQRRIGHEHVSTTIGTYGGMIGDMSNDTMERAAGIMAGTQNAPTIAPAAPVVVEGSVVDVGELALEQ